MKDTYLEGAQQEVFAEAKNPKYFAPTEALYKAIKKEVTSMYELFARGTAEDLDVTNPLAISKLAEKFAARLINKAIQDANEYNGFYDEFEDFKNECKNKKWAKEK